MRIIQKVVRFNLGHCRVVTATVFVILVLSYSLNADVRLPAFFSDKMVLQRGDSSPIWGRASVGEAVKVRFRGEEYRTVVNENGRWKLDLDPGSAGGPFEMVIEGENRLALEDIYVGDVWLASGQSNMELSMERVKERFPEEIKHSENHRIRYFGVKTDYDFNGPKTDLNSDGWLVANPSDVLRFGAVGYFFAKAIEERVDVPIGIVNASVGGSPLEAWLSEEALKRDYPEAFAKAVRWRNADLIAKAEAENSAIYAAWDRAAESEDAGLNGPTPWYASEWVDDDWQRIMLPTFWDEGGIEPMNGVVWFQKTFDLPDSLVGKAGNLYLGTIVDADETYLNGVKVGNTTYQYPPRRYKVPAGLLKQGGNVVTIRAFSHSGRGSFTKDKPFQLKVGDQAIDLRGEWKVRVGAVLYERPGTTFIRWNPLGLYNAMIAPLVPMEIKGVLWYQGESNANQPANYQNLLESLVGDWRSKWGRDDLPFIWAQLPNFMETTKNLSESNWAKLRDLQRRALKIPNTGMSVNIDLGEWNDIHPLDKQSVGERLALEARRVAYHEDSLVSSGPLVQSARLKGKRVRLAFDTLGSRLVVKGGGKPKHFALAGEDGRFVWAKARLVGDGVEIWSPKIDRPKIIRYAWANNPDFANLYNEEGLPASPFEIEVK